MDKYKRFSLMRKAAVVFCSVGCVLALLFGVLAPKLTQKVAFADEGPALVVAEAVEGATYYDTQTAKELKECFTVKVSGSEDEITDYEISIPGGALKAGEDATLTFTYIYGNGEGQQTSTGSFDIAGAKIQADTTLTAVEFYLGGLTLKGGYYKTADGSAAFAQGMTAAMVYGNLPILATYEHGSRILTFTEEGTLETGEVISGLTTEFNGVSVPVAATVKVGSVALTTNITLSFEPEAIASIVVLDGWTQPNDLESSTETNNLVSMFNGYVQFGLNNGKTRRANLGDFEVVTESGGSSLAPSGQQIQEALAALANGEEYTYSKSVVLRATENTAIVSKPIPLNNIAFGEIQYVNSGINSQSGFPAQYARSPLNVSGLTVDMAVGEFGDMAYIPLSEFDYTYTYTYIDGSKKTKEEGAELTRSVTAIQISTTIKYGNGAGDTQTVRGNYRGFTINPITQSLPEVATSAKIEESITIGGLVTNDAYGDNMVVSVLDVDNTADKYYTLRGDTITFNRGGTYTVQIAFANGTSSDFQWAAADNIEGVDRRNDFTLEYTVQVEKGEVAIEYTVPTVTYGDGESVMDTGTLTVTSNSAPIINGLNKGDVTAAGADDNDVTYAYYYYGSTYTGHTTVGTATATMPTDAGDYYVFIKTSESAFYQKGESKPVALTIKKAQLSTSGFNSSVTFDKAAHKLSDFLGTYSFKYADTQATVFSYTDASYTNAGTYTAAITISNSNYEWESKKSSETLTLEITKRTINVTASASGFTYGDKNALSASASLSESGYIKLSATPTYFTAANAAAPASSELFAVGNYYAKWTWDLESGVTEDDITVTGNLDSGKTFVKADFTVAKKALSGVSFAGGNTTYTGTATELSLVGWSALKSTVDGIEGAGFNLSNVVTVTITNNITDTKSETRTFAYGDGKFSVLNAGTYTIKVTLRESNYAWAAGAGDTDGIFTFTYTVNKATVTVSIVVDEENDSAATYTFTNGEHKPTIQMNFGSVTAGTFTYTDSVTGANATDGKAIKVGTYTLTVATWKVMVGGEDWTTNYNLSNPSVTFRIEQAVIKTPQLKGGSSLTATEPVYKAVAYDFFDFIDETAEYIAANYKNKISWEIFDGKGETELKNVIYSSGSVTSYVIHVKITDTNFQWDEGTGIKTYSVKITPRDLEFGLADGATSTFTYNNTVFAPSLVAKWYEGNTNVAVNTDNAFALTYTNTVITVSEAKNAGEYTVSAKLASENGNYKLIANSFGFTIQKRSVSTPFANASSGIFTGSAQNINFTNLNDLMKVNTLTRTIPGGEDGWFTDKTRAALTTTLNNPGNYFADGKFTFTDAGVYAAVFALKDSTNYYWDGEETEKTNFTATGEYTFALDGFLTVERMQIAAPALGTTYRLQEWQNGQKNMSELFNGAFVEPSTGEAKPIAGLGYDLYYYKWTQAKSYHDGQSTQHTGLDSTKVSADDKGIYAVQLTLAGTNPFNYQWVANTTDDDDVDNIYRYASYSYGESNGNWTVYIRLHYAVTSTVLTVRYDFASNVVFGYNGFEEGDEGYVATTSAESEGSFFKLRGTDVTGSDAETVWNCLHNAAEGDKNKASFSVQYYRNGSETEYKNLLNGLPIDVGQYEAVITIDFPGITNTEGQVVEASDYQQITTTVTFTVNKRALEFTWSGATSVVYDGEAHSVTASINNLPIMNADGTPYAVTINDYTYNDKVATSATNKGTYAVKVSRYTIDGKENNNNFALEGSTSNNKTFSITARKVTVTPNAVTGENAYIYGDDFGAYDYTVALTEAIDGQTAIFVGDYASHLTFKIVAADGTTALTKTDLVAGGSYSIVFYGKTSADSVAYLNNYEITFEKATFTVAPRKITVTLDGDSAKSKYGVEITADKLYNAIASIALTDGSSGDALVFGATAKDVFELSTSASSAKPVGDGYAINCSTATALGSNYDVKFNTENVMWEITPADITGVTVAGYNGTYDGDAHAIFTTTKATTVNGEALTWYYIAKSPDDDTAPSIPDDPASTWTVFPSALSTITNVAESKTYWVLATAPNHNSVLYNGAVSVTVIKKTLTVSASFAIVYGEEKPETVAYEGGTGYEMGLTALLRKENGIYTVSGFATKADETSFYTSGNNFVTGAMSYSTDYEKGNPAGGTYAITLALDALECANYDFEAAAENVLTVNKFTAKITIANKSLEYYYSDAVAEQTALTYTASDFIKGTYTTFTALPDLDNIVFKLSCNAFVDGQTNAAGDYPITGSFVGNMATNYALDFTSANFTITPTDFEEVTATAYTKEFDNESHTLIEVEAKAKGNNAVTIYYMAVNGYTKDQQAQLPAGSTLNWSGALTDAPEAIDACGYWLYYRVTAESHNDAYRAVWVEITQTTNEYTGEFKLFDTADYETYTTGGTVNADMTAAWTYGLYDANGNVNGYNNAGAHATTDLTAKYTRLSNGGTNAFVVTVFRYAGDSWSQIGTSYTSVSNAFASIFASTGFDAGIYRIRVYMSETENYTAIDNSYIFRVEKKTLSVTVNDTTTKYGEAAEYSVTYSGFVKATTNGAVQTLESSGMTEPAVTYTTAYTVGSSVTENGYAVSVNTITYSSDNYEIDVTSATAGKLTVLQRTLNVTINDQTHTYNAAGAPDYSVMGVGYTISGDEVYSADVDNNGVQTVFSVISAALSSTENLRTNNAGKYAIYAVYNSASASTNYKVTVITTQYNGGETIPSEAIGGKAATYTINPAVASFNMSGPWANAAGTQSRSNFYNGLPLYYTAAVTGDLGLSVNIEYYLVEGTTETLLEGAPKNVGTYKAYAKIASNPNYIESSGSWSGFEILKGRMIITAKSIEIEYGTAIPTTAQDIIENPRITGIDSLTDFDVEVLGEGYTGSSVYEELNLSNLAYSFGSYTLGAAADYIFSLSISGITSANFVITYSTASSPSKVTPRSVIGWLKGADEGNEYAKAPYTGLDHDSRLSALLDDADILAEFIDVTSGDYEDNALGDFKDPENDHSRLKDLQITIRFNGEVINADDKYTITATDPASSGRLSNYAINWGRGRSTSNYIVKPAELTLTANSTNVVFGDEIEYGYTAKGFVNGETLDNLDEDAFEGKLIYTLYSDMTAYEANNVATYTAFGNHAGETFVVSLKTSTLSFKNYEVSYEAEGATKTGTVTIVSRVVTATTHNEVFEPVPTDYTKGMARNAKITFRDSNGAVMSVESDEYTVTYNIEGGAAPTVVGEYKATVEFNKNKFGKYDYVFATEPTTKVILDFEVEKYTFEMNDFQWERDESTINDANPFGTYTIRFFISSIMSVRSFDRGYIQNGINQSDAVASELYQITSAGLSINPAAAAPGTYSIQIRLTDTANYQWSEPRSYITISFSTTTEDVGLTITIDGWTYGQYDEVLNKPSANGLTDRVSSLTVFTYISFNYNAAMASTTIRQDIKNVIASGSGALPKNATTVGLTNVVRSMFPPTDAGTYLLEGYYNDGSLRETAYYVFTISPAEINGTELRKSIFDGYTGEVLTHKVEFADASVISVRTEGGVNVTNVEGGFSFTVTNANPDEGYKITYSIIGNNYVWSDGTVHESDGSVVMRWYVSKAQDNAVTLQGAREYTYGQTVQFTATTKYGTTRVTYGYILKSAYNAQTTKDDDWTVGVPKTAGVYLVKAVAAETANTSAWTMPADEYVTITINKAQMHISASGSMTYGSSFNTATRRYSFATEDFAAGDTLANSFTVGTVNYTFNDLVNPNRLEAGTYKIRVDLGASSITSANYVLVPVDGDFVVSKAHLTATIDNVTTSYTVVPTLDTSIVSIAGTFFYGETIADLQISLKTSATKTSPIGSYFIEVDSYYNKNYDVNFGTGILNVVPLEISIEITSSGYTYGELPSTVATIGNITSEIAGADLTIVRNELELSFVYSGTCNDGTNYAETSIRPTNAGSYLARVAGVSSNYTLVSTASVPFEVRRATIDVSKISIDSAVYTGEEIIPVVHDEEIIAAYGNAYYSTHDTCINVGTYAVMFVLNDTNNYQWSLSSSASYAAYFEITKATDALTGEIGMKGWSYGAYDATENLPTAEVKSGERIIYTYSTERDGTYEPGAPTNGNVGTYWVRATVQESANWKAFVSAPVSFEITKATLAAPTLRIVTEGEGKNDTYFNGTELYIPVEGYNRALMNVAYANNSTINGNDVSLIAILAGEYSVTFSLIDAENYAWEANTQLDENGNVVLGWTIARQQIKRPTPSNKVYIVDGSLLTYLPEGFDETLMSISGNETYYGGVFEVIVSLIDTANYEWDDGTIDPLPAFNWSVVGVQTVFIIVISVVSGIAGALAIAAIVQVASHKSKVRRNEKEMDARDAADAAVRNAAAAK